MQSSKKHFVQFSFLFTMNKGFHTSDSPTTVDIRHFYPKGSQIHFSALRAEGDEHTQSLTRQPPKRKEELIEA